MLTEKQKRENRIRRSERTLKQYTLGKAVNIVAREFQRLVRIKSADSEGYCLCVTCGHRGRWDDSSIHAGHFVSGRNNSILFDERNCHPQCYRCNVHLSGNQERYTEFMRNRYGPSVICALTQTRNETRHYDRWELAEMLVDYRAEIRELKRG